MSLSKDELLFSEAPERLATVARLYRLILGRKADVDGLLHYTRKINDGEPLQKIAESFLLSKEAAESIGERSLIEIMYLRSGLALPSGDDGKKLADVAIELVNSPNVIAFHQHWRDVYQRGIPVTSSLAYQWWRDEQVRRRAAMPGPSALHGSGPELSIVMAIADPQPEAVATTAASLQNDGLLELIVVCLRGGAVKITDALSASPAKAFVKIVPVSRLNASAVAMWRRGLHACRGRYIAKVEPGDRLAADLGSQFQRLSSNPQIVTTDGDELQVDGSTAYPTLVGSWDPDGALAGPPGGLVAVLRPLAYAIGGFGAHRGEAGNWDFLLRASEHCSPSQIHHLAIIGRHRTVEKIPAAGEVTSVQIVRAHLRRRGEVEAVVSQNEISRLVRVEYRLPDKIPRVSVIIPTRNNFKLLRGCISSIVSRSDYANYEIVVIDNANTDNDVLEYFVELRQNSVARVLYWPDHFNWGGVNNFAVSQTDCDVVVLLNDDTEVIGAGWLRELVSQAMRRDVGAVGARLLYPDGGIQHAGMAMGRSGNAFHIRRHARFGEVCNDRQISTVRTVSAATGACLALRRAVYWEVGGIESEKLRVTWSDVDLCLKLQAAGYRIVWTPYAELYHLEQATRGSDDTPWNRYRHDLEGSVFRKRWGPVVMGYDPYFSPYLDPESSDPIILPDVEPAVSYRTVSLPASWRQLPRTFSR